MKQFLPFSCLDCTGDLLQLYCGIVLCVIILFTDKLNPSTDIFPFYYINVKFFKKSVKTCDGLKPFPKSCDKTHSPPGVHPDGVFFAHKPRQIACVGFVGRDRVRAPSILSRDTERNRARQIFSLVIASTISLTAKEKPRTNASRSPRFISSVWLSLIISSIFIFS